MCDGVTIDTSDENRPTGPDPTSGHAPRRTVIADSWRRSALGGLSPDARPEPLLTDVEAADPLLDAARPVLRRAGDELADTDTALLLVDQHCRLVSRVFSGVAVERSLDGLGATTGAMFDEEAMGTTALGTPAEIRGGIAINGSEHYLEQFKSLSCFGQPIIHPTTRRLAGIVCMTEIGPRSNPLSVPFVNGLVAGIQDRLLDRSRSDQRALIDAFALAASRRDIAVAALGDDLQLTNALAAQLLTAADFGTLRTLAAEDPTATLRSEPTTLALGSGGIVDVVVERIGGIRHAALFRLRPTRVAAREPVTTAAIHTADTGRAVAASTAVTGEPGSGRTSLARRGDHLYVDVAGGAIVGRRLDLPDALRQSRASGRALVVDDADMLDDDAVRLLHKAITQRAESPDITVVTGPATAARPAVSSLISVCRNRIDAPALRQRPGEIAAIAQRLLGDLSPHLTLTASAADALISAEWPGNLTELRIVVEQAAAGADTRNAWQVEVTDLPARYRTISRASRLSGREHAERQAIIDALDASGRNKVHAAKSLGISRTTLYARIRALGIDG